MITHNEIAVDDKDTAFTIAKLLIDQSYVVMLSKEESLYVINYEYSQYSDRNDVIFLNREGFFDKYIERD